MKAYLLITGFLFLAIAVAHIWRMTIEPNLAREPWFVVLTIIAAGLGGWAWRLHARLRQA